MRQHCSLVLNTGESFEGELIGAPVSSSGELVFTTGMVGYTEAITDPSYFGQILIFSYPLIGNYGIPSLPKTLQLPMPKGFESLKAHTSAVIMNTDSIETFHWNSLQSMDMWLKAQGVPGIVGLDTRHLVQLVRNRGNVLGRVVPQKSEGVRKLGDSIFAGSGDEYFDPGKCEILSQVSVHEPIRLGTGSVRIGLVDCGVKWNIIRQLVELGCQVDLLPWDTDLSNYDCDAWLLSNGPGDPKRTGPLVPAVASLLKEDRPILGICLGHQILSLAAGAKTERMEYGHRSHNQPVKEVGSRRGYITSQNHGYVVIDNSLPQDWEPWFVNINDNTIEGIRHRTKPFRSVQFHPEAAGGPRDTSWILEKFIAEVHK
jgi:carbamoyl-phosphate synthase small subunit